MHDSPPIREFAAILFDHVPERFIASSRVVVPCSGLQNDLLQTRSSILPAPGRASRLSGEETLHCLERETVPAGKPRMPMPYHLSLYQMPCLRVKKNLCLP